jgi:hypothetical protein
MPVIVDRPEAPSTIRSDLGAIFVSLELSRSTWLITSLSPGGGEKMSKRLTTGTIARAFAISRASFPKINVYRITIYYNGVFVAQESGGARRRERGLRLETAQYRVVAHRHADWLDQSLSWAPADAMPENINDFRRPIGASRSRSRDFGQLRGEGLTLAGSVSTLPALEAELHSYGGPCEGKSCRWRSCQPCRRIDRLPQSGQTPGPMAAAEISHWRPSCLASKMRMPFPSDQIDFLATRLS